MMFQHLHQILPSPRLRVQANARNPQTTTRRNSKAKHRSLSVLTQSILLSGSFHQSILLQSLLLLLLQNVPCVGQQSSAKDTAFQVFINTEDANTKGVVD